MRAHVTSRRSPIGLGLAVVATLALCSGPGLERARAQEGDPAADETITLRGNTEGGDARSFTGTARLTGTGDARRAVATVSLDGLGERTIELPVPGDRVPTGFRIRELPPSQGIDRTLEQLLADGEAPPPGPRFELVPVFGPVTPPEDAPGGDAPTPAPGAGDERPEGPFVVEIVKADGSALEEGYQVLVGEKVELKAVIRASAEGGAAPAIDEVTLRWQVPGSTIKSYRHALAEGLANVWAGREDAPEGADMHVGTIVHERTPLGEADLTGEQISFYWTDDGQAREITVTAIAGDKRADGAARVDVARSETPALDLYTDPAKTAAEFDVLPGHASWHRNFNGSSRFILFHREWLRAYNAWRETFGYLPVEAVDDVDQPGGGLAPPSYLTVEGGEEESPKHDKKALNDFETLEQLGDDLESPWHNQGHVTEGGRVVDGATPNSDMLSVMRAPTREVFYMWHTKVDNKAREWEYVHRPKEPDFRVEIRLPDDTPVPEGHQVLVGEKVELIARLISTEEGKDAPALADVESWQWQLPGTVIQDYRHDLAGVDNVWDGRAGTKKNDDGHAGTISHVVTPMSETALRAGGTIQFYWTSDGQQLEVSLTVRVDGAEATGTAKIDVRRSERPAEDVYTAEGKVPASWDILPGHASWHRNYRGGDRFIFFHREWLRAYNAWRQTFGYLPVEAQPDVDQPGGGLEPPSYLTEEGGRERSPKHRKKKLEKFDSISDLGDDLEAPWHNQGHGVEAGRVIDGERPNAGMSSVLRAPTCEVFYMWHTKIDNKAREYELLKSGR